MIVRVVGQYTFVYQYDTLYCIANNTKIRMSSGERDYFLLMNRYSANAFFGVSLLYDYPTGELEVAKDFQGNIYRNIVPCAEGQMNQLVHELIEFKPVDWFHERHQDRGIYFISFIYNYKNHGQLHRFLKSTIEMLEVLR